MDEDNGKQLYGPLENYNTFASQYLCSLLARLKEQRLSMTFSVSTAV